MVVSLVRPSSNGGNAFNYGSLASAQQYNASSGIKGRVMILDSTLREGEQAPNISFTMRQRLQIAWMLDYFGVDAIEISPVVSKDHEESCRALVRAGLEATIVAQHRALPGDIDVALRCGVDWIAMFHSTSDLHLKYKFRISREEALRRAVQAVEYAKAHGLKLRFTMEDASRTDFPFLEMMCRAVAEAGADRIGLPDTLGILTPGGMYNLVRKVREVVDLPIDLHCHNDLGLALANSLAGLEAGASQVHVTIDGLGERIGIASLAEVAVALTLLYGMDLDVRLDMLKELSNLVSMYTGVSTPPAKPLVGENAYRHKAGTHIAAIIRNPEAYELVSPKVVGNRRRVIFGELAGKNAAHFLLKVLGLNPSDEEAAKLAQGLKNLRCGDLFELTLTEAMEAEAVRLEERIS